MPPGSEGVTVLEYWQGNRSPWSDPLATGAIWGLTLSHREEHVFRAVMEGAAFGTRLILERLRESGVEVRELRACGGGIKSALWLQIHADVCGLPSPWPLRRSARRWAGRCARRWPPATIPPSRLPWAR